MKMRSPIFGEYNPFIDESVHIFLAFSVSLAGYLGGLDLEYALVCFLSGVFIDLDHLLNGFFARLFRIHSYEKDFKYGSHGYTIKLLHGFDMAFLISAIVFLISNDLVFSVTLFGALCFHELWDFLVYPFSWSELFLVTRAKSGFKPGKRKAFTGFFFRRSSLNY